MAGVANNLVSDISILEQRSMLLAALNVFERRLTEKIDGGFARTSKAFDVDPVLAASASSTIYDEPVFDKGPVFDEEAIFDEGPLFDEEPSDIAMVGHNATAWSSAALQQASSTSTTNKELVLDPGLAAVAPSNINADAPSTCSTKCPSHFVDITAPAVVNAVAEEVFVAPDHAPAPSTPSKTSTKYVNVIVSDKLDVTLDIYSGDATATFLLLWGMFKDVKASEGRPHGLPAKVVGGCRPRHSTAC